MSGNLQIGSVWSSGTPGSTTCSLHAIASGTSLSATKISSGFVVQNVSSTEDWSNLPSGILTITSFQTNLAVYLAISKGSATGGCLVRSMSVGNANSIQPAFQLIPIDYQLPLPTYIDQTPYTVTATSVTAPTAPYGRFEASGSGTTITLFACTTSTKGYNVEVKRVDASNNITVARSGTDTIDGATSDILSVNYQATQYVCNGSGGWRRF